MCNITVIGTLNKGRKEFQQLRVVHVEINFMVLEVLIVLFYSQFCILGSSKHP